MFALIVCLYVLGLNVHTYCMLYILAKKKAFSVVYEEWVNLTIVSSWHLVL